MLKSTSIVSQGKPSPIHFRLSIHYWIINALGKFSIGTDSSKRAQIGQTALRLLTNARSRRTIRFCTSLVLRVSLVSVLRHFSFGSKWFMIHDLWLWLRLWLWLNIGTFWYHSHLSTQYCDGLRGAFVVYDPEDPHKLLYDVDDGLYFILKTFLTTHHWC